MAGAYSFEGGPVTSTGAEGQSPLPELMINPLDSEEAHRLKDGAQKFNALAASGGFAVNEAGFQAYNRVCEEFLHGYADIKRNFLYLTTRAQMGSSGYATKVAGYNVTVADGDTSSLIPNLELLKESIEQVQDALKIARNNYRAGDSDHAQTLSQVHGGK
jgi:hypothetical protein